MLSDQDGAYATPAMNALYKAHNIEHIRTSKDDHHRLGKVNRLIRTLRDLHGVNKTFSDKDMKKAINVYNNSRHTDTEMAPNEMTKEKEMEYIKKMDEKVADKMTHSYGFRRGDYVRVILDKNPLEKHRNDLSMVSYKIAQQNGRSYVVQAKDGSTEKFPGFKLVLCTDLRKYPWADSINDNKAAFIDKIVDAPDSKHYTVRFEGEKGTRTITTNMMREENKTRLSLEERRYWARVCHLGTPQEDLSKVPARIKNMIPKVITRK
jgi:hypothetical protein